MDGVNVRLQGKDISRTEGTDTILKDTDVDTPTADIGATKRVKGILREKMVQEVRSGSKKIGNKNERNNRYTTS